MPSRPLTIPAADLDLRLAWRRDDPQLESDAIAFWQRHHLLAQGTAAQARAKELVALAYRNGELIGVSTAVLARLELLRARFAIMRAAVDPAHRRTHVVTALTLFTREVIETWSYRHPEERVAGLAAILESPDLVARQKQPFWPQTRLGLVGYTQDGRQIRVSWFQDFELD